MKKIIVLLSLIIGFNSFAQIKITDQPGESYYEFVKSTCKGKMPLEKELLAAKASTTLPDNFLDTLKKYDWVQLGGYSWDPSGAYWQDYFDAKLFENEAKSQYQFEITRLVSDGTVAMFSLSKFQQTPSTVTTTSFNKAICSIYTTQKTKTGVSFIKSMNYGEASYSKIVSFKNNVLIYDVTKSGKITDAKVRFRQVYYAIPKKFKWDF